MQVENSHAASAEKVWNSGKGGSDLLQGEYEKKEIDPICQYLKDDDVKEKCILSPITSGEREWKEVKGNEKWTWWQKNGKRSSWQRGAWWGCEEWNDETRTSMAKNEKTSFLLPSYHALLRDDTTPHMDDSKDVLQQHNIAATVGRLLSRQNVATDPHLAALMEFETIVSTNTTQTKTFPPPPPAGRVYITLSRLSHHPALSGLAVTEQQLRVALEAPLKSGNIEISQSLPELRVYPVLKAKRRTLVIRSIAPTDEADFKNLLLQCPAIRSEQDIFEIQIMVSTIANALYVTLATEELAQETAMWLMAQKFKDETIRVGIKTEPQYTVFKPLPPLPKTNKIITQTTENINEHPRGRRRKIPNRKTRQRRKQNQNTTSGLDLADFPPLETSIAYNCGK